MATNFGRTTEAACKDIRTLKEKPIHNWGTSYCYLRHINHSFLLLRSKGHHRQKRTCTLYLLRNLRLAARESLKTKLRTIAHIIPYNNQPCTQEWHLLELESHRQPSQPTISRMLDNILTIIVQKNKTSIRSVLSQIRNSYF